MDSLATSRRAAQRHLLAVAAGAPRSAPWIVPSAAVSAVGAALALPLFRPAGLAAAALTALLLAVHRQDRRNAWRYAPEPATPARFLPPLRDESPTTGSRTDAPAAPTGEPVRVLAQVAAVPALPVPV